MRKGIRHAECKGKTPTITAKHYNPDNRANQQANNSHGKAGAPKAPTKGGHGIEIASVNKDDLDDDKIDSVGARKPALLQALAAAAIWGKVGVRRGDGGAGMRPDDNIVAVV